MLAREERYMGSSDTQEQAAFLSSQDWHIKILNCNGFMVGAAGFEPATSTV
jgi:hypothetical protein